LTPDFSYDEKYTRVLEYIEEKYSENNGKINGVGPNDIAKHFKTYNKLHKKWLSRYKVIQMINWGIDKKQIKRVQKGGGKKKNTILKAIRSTTLGSVRNVPIHSQKTDIENKISKLNQKTPFSFEDFLDFLRLERQIKELPFLVNNHYSKKTFEGHKFASERMNDLKKIEERQKNHYSNFQKAKDASERLETLLVEHNWSILPKPSNNPKIGKIRTHHNTIKETIKDLI